jgi:hypothetical protein
MRRWRAVLGVLLLVSPGVVLALSGCSSRPAGPAPRASGAPPPPVAPPAAAPVPGLASSAAAPAASSSSPPDPFADAARRLAIPARAQAPEAPPAGWCGETAIQEGLLHLGVWAPQAFINRAGKPTHPDLYSPDIPVALSELGVRYAFYSGARGFDAFASWARAALDAGDPVLAGVKILPTEHPEWGLDHFVLVVGHGAKGLLVNTTWGTQAWVADTRAPGLSFVNAFYGIRLLGLALPPGAVRARVTLVGERADGVTLRVSCEGATVGVTYRLERRTAAGQPAPVWSEERPAEGAAITRELTVEAGRPSRFHCVPL